MPQGFMRATGWLLLIVVLLQPSFVFAEESAESEGVGQAVADTYGFAHWGQIEEIRYTFRVTSANRDTARSWTWRPIEGRVTLEIEGEEPVTYLQSDLAGEVTDEIRKTDHRFINDSYWLLFPYQLVWSDQTVTDAGESPLPIGEGTARKLIVQYPNEGGYTPGDAYDLYLDDAGMIVQWDFRKSGGDTSRPMTWENNIDLGPIKVCTDHYNADKSFRLWFDGLKVTTTDGEVYAVE